jgi:hypothetical protein
LRRRSGASGTIAATVMTAAASKMTNSNTRGHRVVRRLARDDDA